MNSNRSAQRPCRYPSGVAVLMIIVIQTCAGCGQSARHSDQEEGRKALQTMLDAWKGGEKPDALAKHTPPIRVTDGDWMSGLKLQSYKADDAQLVGSDLNYNVALELKSAKGKVVKKSAVYAVTTSPELMVRRQDSL